MDQKILNKIQALDNNDKAFMIENKSMFSFSYKITIDSNKTFWEEAINNDSINSLETEKEDVKTLLNSMVDTMREDINRGERRKVATALFNMESYSLDTLYKYIKEVVTSGLEYADDSKLEDYSIIFLMRVVKKKATAYKITDKVEEKDMTSLISIDRKIDAILGLLGLISDTENKITDKVVAMKYLGKLMDVKENIYDVFKEYIKRKFLISERRYDGEVGNVNNENFDDLKYIMNFKQHQDFDETKLEDFKNLLTNYVHYKNDNPSIILLGNGGYDKDTFSLLEMKYQVMEITKDLLKDYIGSQYDTTFKIKDDMIAYIKDGDYDEVKYPIMKLFTKEPHGTRTIITKDNEYYLLFQIKEKDNVCYGISFPEVSEGSRKLIQIEKPEDVSYSITEPV